MAKFSVAEIAKKVKDLRPGPSFKLETESERKQAIYAGKYQGKDIITKKLRKGGYVVIAVPS